MLRKRDVRKTHGHPLPKIIGPDEEGVTSQELRAAQIAAGELMWVTTRTRPDVAYATSLVSRLLHRRPRYAKEMADCIFNYLAATAKRMLTPLLLLLMRDSKVFTEFSSVEDLIPYIGAVQSSPSLQ